MRFSMDYYLFGLWPLVFGLGLVFLGLVFLVLVSCDFVVSVFVAEQIHEISLNKPKVIHNESLLTGPFSLRGAPESNKP